MIDGAFNLSENICRQPALLSALGQAAQTEHARINALTDTSQARRGMRHGMLEGMVSGACLAHAITLPYDHIVGTGPTLFAATWAHHRALAAHQPVPQHDPFVVYGAPRGLLGPIVAAAVGFTAGTSKGIGMLAGVAAGVVTSPIVLARGGHSADAKAHIWRYKQRAGQDALRWGSAGAAVCAAMVGDTARLPSVALKISLPLVGLGLGACVGSLQGLREAWPGELSAWVANCGQGARAMSQQGVVIALEMGFLWCWRQARLSP